jgi:hypothetical protein
MSISKRTVLAVAAIAGIAAAGGSAFTDSNTVPDSVAGYGTSTVSGATVSTVVHTLSGDGSKITGTTITFSTAQSATAVVKAGFGSSDLEACTLGGGNTTATCTYADGYDTATATSFNVAVS